MIDVKKRPHNFQDLAGKTFGRLTVLSFCHGKKWLCQCSCGNEKSIDGYSLRSGGTKSCGCLNKELASQRNRIHGGCVGGNGPEFRIWTHIKTRTLNSKSQFFERYGGRGIKICDRWKNSFENFLEDMGYRPSAMHSIERIDNNGGYSKENCKWATSKQQARNRSSNHKITFNGDTRIAIEWAEKLGINYKRFHKLLSEGNDMDNIIHKFYGTMGTMSCQ